MERSEIRGGIAQHPRIPWRCIVHFLCLPKENEPKEKAPVPLGPSDCPALLEAVWILQTRFAQTVQNPFRQLLRCSASANGKREKPGLSVSEIRERCCAKFPGFQCVASGLLTVKGRTDNWLVYRNTTKRERMETFRINEVRMVRGNTLYPTWKSEMQIVSTDKGEFIDNAPGLGPFDPKWKDIGASPGFDWKSKVGEEVTGVIRESRGYKWLNKN